MIISAWQKKMKERLSSFLIISKPDKMKFNYNYSEIII